MNIAILGTGNMGRAIISGLLRTHGSAVTLTAFDKTPESLAGLDPRVIVAAPDTWFNNTKALDAIIIAVKPFDVASAIASVLEVPGAAVANLLWISIAAGKNIASLKDMLPAEARLCRVMPNTPALIGEGMSAYSLSENALPADSRIVMNVFSACGKTIEVPEKMMNAVTGLSGSGPAYVFHFLESLAEAGVMAGLPHTIALECAMQTVLGSVKMAAESADSLDELKRKVMTPAGTTASAITVLEQHAFKHTLIKAVAAAARRSRELEQGSV